MRHEVADRDAGLSVSLESRYEIRDGIVETDTPLLYQPNDCGGRRNHFGQRCEVEDRIDRHHLRRRIDSALTVGLLEQDLVPTTDQNNRAWRLPGANRRLDHSIDAGKSTCLACLRVGSRRLSLDDKGPTRDQDPDKPAMSKQTVQHLVDLTWESQPACRPDRP